MRLVELIESSMTALAEVRPVFHSEADFQLALGWQIRSAHPSARVRLEKRVQGLGNKKIALDMLVTIGSRAYVIELKYPKARLVVTIDGETFDLRAGDADDLTRYEFL